MDKAADGRVSLSGPAMVELLSALHERGAAFRFKARGSSMYPAIRDGDVVTVSPLRGAGPGRGEVVAFRHPDANHLILHRVVRVLHDSFQIKGDNSAEGDGLIPAANLLGVVTKVERGGRSVFWPDRLRWGFWANLYFNLHPIPLGARHFLGRSKRRLLRSVQRMPVCLRATMRPCKASMPAEDNP